ncbi:MAG: hypothetical protein KAX84_01580 [Burkholderiales bacterium]|nr:hypothetical protein [Burkholderiales bacterium]
MPRRADVLAAQSTGLVQFNGAGAQWLIQTPAGVLYLVYVDTGSDVAFKKSTNYGLTWSNPTVVFAGTTTAVAVWYDRWSDIAAGLIHIAYQESATDDTLYRTVNTESSDALSTQTVIFAGTSTATGGCLAITRARGGNVYCATMIDAGAEGGFFRLPNANVPSGAWDAARTTVFEAITGDMVLLFPGFAADNQDIICIFWDASANEISRKVYDDSGNSWAETSIATSMADQVATTAFPHFDGFVDIGRSNIVIVAWNGVDTASADLRCWTVDESAITEMTNVVANGTDDQGLCAITTKPSTEEWYCFYGGKSDGSETFLTSINIYYKVSLDRGTTWGPETQLTNSARDTTWLIGTPRWENQFTVAFHNDIALDELMVSAPILQPRANFVLGL